MFTISPVGIVTPNYLQKARANNEILSQQQLVYPQSPSFRAFQFQKTQLLLPLLTAVVPIGHNLLTDNTGTGTLSATGKPAPQAPTSQAKINSLLISEDLATTWNPDAFQKWADQNGLKLKFVDNSLGSKTARFKKNGNTVRIVTQDKSNNKGVQSDFRYLRNDNGERFGTLTTTTDGQIMLHNISGSYNILGEDGCWYSAVLENGKYQKGALLAKNPITGEPQAPKVM